MVSLIFCVGLAFLWKKYRIFINKFHTNTAYFSLKSINTIVKIIYIYNIKKNSFLNTIEIFGKKFEIELTNLGMNLRIPSTSNKKK